MVPGLNWEVIFVKLFVSLFDSGNLIFVEVKK